MGNYDYQVDAMKNFLSLDEKKCLIYSLQNPKTIKEVTEIYYPDYILPRQKKRNEEIVQELLKACQKYPRYFNSEEYTFPCFWFNGEKIYMDWKTKELIRTKELNKFGDDPSIGIIFRLNSNYERKMYEIFDKVLGKFNCYVDCWDFGAYMIYDDCVESYDSFYFYSNVRNSVINIDNHEQQNKIIPKELKIVQKIWSNLSRLEGDKGSCTIGEHLNFVYDGKKYRMRHGSPWQGDMSWQPHVDFIKKILKSIGASELQMNYGRLD